MKLMTIINRVTMLDKVMDTSDAFLFGVKGMSVNLPLYFSMPELKIIIKKLNKAKKEVFIALNKNMHNDDLDQLKIILKELDKLKIKGIFYYDLSLLTLKQEGWFNIPLVWSQEHLTTNYDTCNVHKQLGASMVNLSSEITLDEILDIRKNTDMQLIVTAFGYLPMFVSQRNLVYNYLEKFNIHGYSDIYYLQKEGNNYPIINIDNKTEVYSPFILNAYKESLIFKQNKIDYLLLNSFLVYESKFLKILEMFNVINEENAVMLDGEIDVMLGRNTDKGFLYKETIFKVKKNEN